MEAAVDYFQASRRQSAAHWSATLDRAVLCRALAALMDDGRWDDGGWSAIPWWAEDVRTVVAKTLRTARIRLKLPVLRMDAEAFFGGCVGQRPSTVILQSICGLYLSYTSHCML